MEALGLGCGLGEAEIAIGFSKVGFESGPGFVACWEFSPVSAGFGKHSRVK